MRNEISTWARGFFVDSDEYARIPESKKKEWREDERLLVRPNERANAICRATTPADAEWIAARLNLAADLERLIRYDVAEYSVGTDKFRDSLIERLSIAPGFVEAAANAGPITADFLAEDESEHIADQAANLDDRHATVRR